MAKRPHSPATPGAEYEDANADESLHADAAMDDMATAAAGTNTQEAATQQDANSTSGPMMNTLQEVLCHDPSQYLQHQLSCLAQSIDQVSSFARVHPLRVSIHLVRPD